MMFSKKTADKKTPFLSIVAWNYFYQFLRPYRIRLFGISLGFVFQSMLIIPTLLLIRILFDEAIPKKQIDTFFYIGLAIMSIRLLNTLISLFLRKRNLKIVNTAISKLREDLTIRFFSFSRSYYTREDLGIIHTRIVQDTERIGGMSNALISGLFSSVLIILGLALILIYLNWYLFLIVIAFLPVLLFSNMYMGGAVKKSVRAYQRAFEGFSKGTLFLMKFMDLIKIQSVEADESEKHMGTIDNLKEKSTDKNYMSSVNGQLQSFLVGIIGIMVMVGGGISVAIGRMTIGDLMAFYMAANHLQSQLNTLSNSFSTVVTGNESLVTLHNIAIQQETEPYSGNRQFDFTGRLQFQSVSFGYTEKPVLTNISFDISPGKRIAIIGENGAGKSTIINLILGFYKPKSGIITADGINFQEIDFKHFRKQIGVVSQHPPLLPATIRENILYGNPDISDEHLLEVARLTLADQFIKNLPDAYDTQIGDNGILLSGGERQKIAISRALLRRPGLLILDEPTNHLDSLAVRDIMQNIQQLEYNPAILIISHDMGVIKNAETIYVIKNGHLMPFDLKMASQEQSV
jgi:ABC-type bacteriocin/lantibiotic exporter with double-glycine peptidase domain